MLCALLDVSVTITSTLPSNSVQQQQISSWRWLAPSSTFVCFMYGHYTSDQIYCDVSTISRFALWLVPITDVVHSPYALIRLGAK